MCQSLSSSIISIMPTHEVLKTVQLPTLSKKTNCPNPINHASFEFSVGINVNENLNCKVILQEFFCNWKL